MNWEVRPACDDDLPFLAALWHDAWHESHAAFVPEELVLRRTTEEFRSRLDKFGDRLRVAGPVGAPVGFVVTIDDKLDQIYVSDTVRGRGLAIKLCESHIASLGYRSAHLICLPQNARAVAFYQKNGWINRGISVDVLTTSSGPFPIKVLRFERLLTN